MERQQGDSRTTDDGYTIRPYRPADRDGYLSLYDQVLGTSSEEWFDWKYGSNPNLDHVPMIVAERDGEIVGAKPAMALTLSTGAEEFVALQPSDVMVHPDHRRRGLFSRTTEYLKEYYAPREPSLFFNFPNAKTLSGSLKSGWQIVQEVSTYYRIQNPAMLVDDISPPLRGLARLTRPAVQQYRQRRDRRATPNSDTSISVRRHDEIPVDLLATLYRSEVPQRFHAYRDEQFYAWRFHNPKWEYAAYTVHRKGDPVAGIVTGRQTSGRHVVVRLTDIVPLTGNEARQRSLAALLGQILADNRDADVVVARGTPLPTPLLRRFGFLGDDTFPLSTAATPTTQVAYPLTDTGPEWYVAGRRLTSPANWALAFSEEDTA